MATGDTERAVLDAIPAGGCELRRIQFGAGKSRNTVVRALERLEAQGLVERTPNPWGRETPWWYDRLPVAPEGFDPPEIVKDAIYDRGRTEDKTWILLNGKTNEYGCAEAWLHAGEHNARKVYVPLHLLKYPWYSKRRRGEVTTWSSQFSCPVHGECTDEMVKTDKTCALCGTTLNRHPPGGG